MNLKGRIDRLESRRGKNVTRVFLGPKGASNEEREALLAEHKRMHPEDADITAPPIFRKTTHLNH